MRDYISIETIASAGYLVGLFASGFFIASTIVAYSIYEPKSDPDNTNYEEEEEKQIEGLFDDSNYDKKYLDEFNDLSENNLSEEDLVELKNCVLEEETPLGIVKIYYDNNYKGFMWYCDTNHIPYRFLETVARKYIIDNNCLSLYVDLNKEIEKSNQLMEKARTKLKENIKTDLFVKKKDNTTDILKSVGIKNKYLKFKYQGKLDNYTGVETPLYNLINIDFSTFKQLKEKSS